jgi:hypothetical protein
MNSITTTKTTTTTTTKNQKKKNQKNKTKKTRRIIARNVTGKSYSKSRDSDKCSQRLGNNLPIVAEFLHFLRRHGKLFEGVVE